MIINFQLVLKSTDPWIVIFHSGDLSNEWKNLAVANRGVVWFGMVDKRAETELMNTIVRLRNITIFFNLYLSTQIIAGEQ